MLRTSYHHPSDGEALAITTQLMTRKVAVLSVLAIVSVSVTNAIAQSSCTNQKLTCNSHPSGRMENFNCQFSNGGIYASYYFVGVAGQHIDVFMQANAFQPRLYLYSSAGGYPVATDNPA